LTEEKRGTAAALASFSLSQYQLRLVKKKRTEKKEKRRSGHHPGTKTLPR